MQCVIEEGFDLKLAEGFCVYVLAVERVIRCIHLLDLLVCDSLLSFVSMLRFSKLKSDASIWKANTQRLILALEFELCWCGETTQAIPVLVRVR